MIITDIKEIKSFIKKLTDLNQLAKTLNKHSYYYVKKDSVYSDTIYSSSEASGVCRLRLNPEFNDITEYVDGIFIHGKHLYAQLKELKNPTELEVKKGYIRIVSETINIELDENVIDKPFTKSYKPYYKSYVKTISKMDNYDSHEEDITYVVENFGDKSIPVLVEIDNIKIRLAKKLIKGLSRISNNIEPLFLKIMPLSDNEYLIRIRYMKQNVKKSKKGDTIQDIAVIDSYYKIINF